MNTNFEFSTPNLAEIEQILTNVFSKSNCPCHVINPNKTRIILWKEIKEGQEIYHLRIGLQKLTSYQLTDRYGNPYWKFNDCSKSKAEGEKEAVLDNVAKFKRREVKSQEINHERNSENHQPEPPQSNG